VRLRSFASFTLTVVIFFGSACSESRPSVAMSDGQRFDPDTITVKAGETITFSNESSDAHSVTAYENRIAEGAEYFASGGFRREGEARDGVSTGLLRGGEDFSVQLDQPGEYDYFCIPHEEQGMRGTIIVEE